MPSWFEQQGVQGYQPGAYEQGGITGGGQNLANAQAGYDVNQWNSLSPDQQAQFTAQGGGPGQQAAPAAPAFNPGQQVGHDGTTSGGLSREAYRDAWQSSGAKSMEDMQKFVAANGGSIQSGNGTVMTPFGESIDMGINARGSAAGNGVMTAGWGGVGGGSAPQGQQPIDNGGQITMGGAPGGGGMPGGGGGGQGAGGGAGGWDGTKYSSTPLTAATPYTPQNVAGPAPLTLGQLSQPNAVTADQVGPGRQVQAGTVTGQTAAGPERVSADQVTGPQALTAAQLGTPDKLHNLTEAELQTDPSYNFRLKQGLGAMQSSAAAKGLLHTGGTLKGLQDYAGESASQEYAAANQRAQQTAQGNITNTANTVGQNNAANAQAYGLTNQYQQQAQLANQSANLSAGQFNSQSGQQNQQFNASQNQQANLANVGNQLQAGQFNSAQGQQAALANLGQNSAQGYANNASNLYANQGTANANAGMAGAGAWSGALNTIGNTAGQAANYWSTQQPYAI